MTQKEPVTFQFAQAGQPGNAGADADKEQPAATQPANGSEQPQYVTRKELDEALAEVKRLTQSMTDKASSRIEKELKRLQGAGIQATPEQVQKLVADAERESQQEQPQQPQQRKAGQPAQQEEAEDPVTTMARSILKRQGIDPASVTPDDPDFNLINPNAATEEEYLASIRAYANAKTARKGSPARMPGMTPTGGPAGGKASLVEQLNAEMLHAGPHNIQKIRQLRQQLASMK